MELEMVPRFGIDFVLEFESIKWCVLYPDLDRRFGRWILHDLWMYEFDEAHGFLVLK